MNALQHVPLLSFFPGFLLNKKQRFNPETQAFGGYLHAFQASCVFPVYAFKNTRSQGNINTTKAQVSGLKYCSLFKHKLKLSELSISCENVLQHLVMSLSHQVFFKHYSTWNCRVYKQCTGFLPLFQLFRCRLTKLLIVENIFGQTCPSSVKQWNIIWTWQL